SGLPVGGVWICAGGVCAARLHAIRSEARKFMADFRSQMLLGDPRERYPELACFPIQVGALDAECLGRGGYPPAVMLQNGRDVIALEAQARFAQRARRQEGRRRTIEPQR